MSHGMGGMGGGPPQGGEGGYNVEEALSDGIATIVFMPNKFDRTAYQLSEKINGCVGDLPTLSVRYLHKII